MRHLLLYCIEYEVAGRSCPTGEPVTFLKKEYFSVQENFFNFLRELDDIKVNYRASTMYSSGELSPQVHTSPDQPSPGSD